MKISSLLIWLCIALLMFSCGELPKSDSIEAVKKKAAIQKEDTNKVWTLKGMSDYYAFNNPDSGILYAKQALALAERLQYDQGIFFSIVSLNNSLYISGNYTLELEYALKAIPLAKKLDDPYTLGLSSGMLSDSYRSLGDYTTAMKYMRIVIKIIEQFYPEELFSAYAVIVPIYVAVHKNDSALICGRKSFELLKANHALYKGNGYQSKYSKSQVYRYLGEAFEANSHYDSALLYYRLSLPISDEINMKIYSIDACNGIAIAYKEKSISDSAIDYAKKVLAEKMINNYPAGKLKATNLLADIYQSLGNTDSSLKYLREALNLKDSLYNSEKTLSFQNSILKEQEKQKAIEAATTVLQNHYRTYFIVGLLIISFVMIGIILRNRRIKQLQNMRNSIADDLHDDIGSALSSISIMSELAKAKSPEAVPLLTSIGESSYAIQENMSDIVWAVNPQNDHFEKVVQRMKLFAGEILEAKNIELVFANDPALAAYSFTMKQRKNLYLFFKEAINNAAKYSDAEKVLVSIAKKEQQLELNIIDNGKGFDTAGAFNGNGMNSFKKRAEELNATFHIVSQINKGTTVQLRFKIA